MLISGLRIALPVFWLRDDYKVLIQAEEVLACLACLL